MRPVAIIQARMGSKRLPGKVLKPILGKPMLYYIVERLHKVPGIAEVVVATSHALADQAILNFCWEHNFATYEGSETDVLDRFYRAAVVFAADPVVRITADCPFVDPKLVQDLLNLYMNGDYDHVGVATGAGAMFLDRGRFPDGMDAECFSFGALERAWREATYPLDREHVTPYIWRNKQLFRCVNLTSEQDYSHLRWTVDWEADFQLVSEIYGALYRDDKPFLMDDILEYLTSHPELVAMNQDLVGKEKYIETWKTAEQPKP